jgi:hypothetical protein
VLSVATVTMGGWLEVKIHESSFRVPPHYSETEARAVPVYLIMPFTCSQLNLNKKARVCSFLIPGCFTFCISTFLVHQSFSPLTNGMLNAPYWVTEWHSGNMKAQLRVPSYITLSGYLQPYVFTLYVKHTSTYISTFKLEIRPSSDKHKAQFRDQRF